MAYSRIVAFDLSLTATGWATFDTTDGPKWGVLPAFKMTGTNYQEQLRLQHILVGIRSYATPGSLVILENFAFGRANQAHQMGGLGHLVRYWLWQSKIPFVLVAPAALKKFACGRGNAKKAEMLKAVFQRFGGIDLTDDNQADAVALCYLGRALVGEYEPTAAFQREVVADLQKKFSSLLAA